MLPCRLHAAQTLEQTNLHSGALVLALHQVHLPHEILGSMTGFSTEHYLPISVTSHVGLGAVGWPASGTQHASHERPDLTVSRGATERQKIANRVR